MALLVPISSTQTDAKSPVDDDLMDAIRVDLEDHETRFAAVKTFAYEFKVNGPLSFLTPTYGIWKRLDGALVASAQTFTRARLYCEVPGTSGTLSVDLRKYKRVDTPIISIAKQYSAAINSITQIAPAIATQSISRATAQISTQSITQWKTAINIQSIILLGSNLVRINLASDPGSDYKQGDPIVVASATAGANNGDFTIVRVNDDGAFNIVITNASGVAQTSAAGTLVLDAWSYNFTNPVNAQFVAGESAIFASHTAGGNNGILAIYAVNSGGNNIVVKNASGVAQAGVAGTTDVGRWTYTYSTAVPSDFVAGESAIFASHSSGANNGTFPVRAVNSGGNNLIIYNTAGVAQGGAAGNANTLRWVYALPSDPASSFNVGERFVASSTTNANNSGVFAVVQIDRSATSNLVIYNTAGVTQAGAAGTLDSERTIISFSSDQSAIYTTASNIEIAGAIPSTANKGYYDVKQVNRGGGANYNVVINNTASVAQASPAGRVTLESKSLLTTPLQLVFPEAGTQNTNNNKSMQYVDTSSMTSAAVVASGEMLGIDILSIPSGNISDIVLQAV